MVQVEVEATLTLSHVDPATGKTVSRPATAEDLERLRYRHQDTMYELTDHNIRALGLDPSEGIGSELRYFIEQSTHWANEVKPDDDEFSALRASLGEQRGGDEGG